MTEPLRIGVAGCGAIARIVHIPLLLTRRDVVIHAVADADKTALAAASRIVPTAVAHESLDALLADPPDAVIVTLPTGAHAAAATQVLNAGCDLYLEKPIASELNDAVALTELWRTTGRIAMVGFQARFNPLIQRLRNLLRSKRAGEPIHVDSVFSSAQDQLPEWKHSRATGGGVLLDLAAHHIDLLRFLFDREPVAVRATTESRRSEDDTAYVEIELKDGPRVQGFYSLTAAEHERIEVFGERARLSVSRFTSLDVSIFENPGQGDAGAHILRRVTSLENLPQWLRARSSPLREPGYATALDAFLRAARTRELDPDAADLRDGLICQAVIDAAERSARSGAVETVSETTVHT